MITVTTAIVNNEWYMTYDNISKEVINMPYYVDENTSATIGISENIKIEVANTEQELLDLINKLGLIVKDE